MIQHMVMFQFRETLNDETWSMVEQGASKLSKEIPGILGMQMGRDFSGRGRGFNVGLTVQFVNREALAAYGPHPAHQSYVEHLRQLGMEDLIVIDFETEGNV
ncbi:Dabb family protein [Alicyclobacillus tolerans]|uniref:Antibiotic biosynthesis monooxygenase (ABM) superfamily enzyme n=2 Tax=Alicyclobacillus tolerans TaxID=90970 RepID=A0ABT9LZH3_9BACL|nr:MULTISPECIES: Dabb family protein [Alicyclobacillus]MDP9729631.1 antibiotic biosynthesis monooxygenase (ABM) superfamily enzyme [Alicyclobacillus tengchongensis]SHK25606.1 Stress responsive A/B Barrel Domain [Alicyclobacillus montanus]